MPYKIQVVDLAEVATATPLHNGTNAQGHPRYPTEFIISATSKDVIVGGSNVTDSTNGETVCKGDAADWEAPLSRGEPDSWDLTQIYYVGGAGKLTLITRAD